jgi:hypothetical protein
MLSVVILGPWPHVLRKKIFTFLNENPIVRRLVAFFGLLCPSRPCASTLLSSEGVSGVAREAGTGAICRTTARPQVERSPVSLGSGSEMRSKEGCSSCRL